MEWHCSEEPFLINLLVFFEIFFTPPPWVSLPFLFRIPCPLKPFSAKRFSMAPKNLLATFLASSKTLFSVHPFQILVQGGREKPMPLHFFERVHGPLSGLLALTPPLWLICPMMGTKKKNTPKWNSFFPNLTPPTPFTLPRGGGMQWKGPIAQGVDPHLKK